ncbi:hypothetical protein BKM31_00575 [[Actinomadura] parvosata subsp. kistnae]|uniref:Uncharacterized protein n=1 Tax=[Actinomadura] parvosata subsp. kistnae TaxID=1909395 RepID=A0A1U9ZQJ3_9ACTN|nr:hypothetical protein BKM31_00575 [Nonomuraea sp. ATCC 55076]
MLTSGDSVSMGGSLPVAFFQANPRIFLAAHAVTSPTRPPTTRQAISGLSSAMSISLPLCNEH